MSTHIAQLMNRSSVQFTHEHLFGSRVSVIYIEVFATLEFLPTMYMYDNVQDRVVCIATYVHVHRSPIAILAQLLFVNLQVNFVISHI